MQMRLSPWRWIPPVCVLALGIGGYELLPRYRMMAIERQENELYTRFRPFLYRWPGAPHAPQAFAATPGRREIDVARIDLGLRQLRIDLPDNPVLLQLSARLSLLTGRYDEAVAGYRRARYLGSRIVDAELAAAFALRAESEGRSSDYGLALEHVARALAEQPRDAAVLFDAAVLMEKTALLRLAASEWRTYIATERNPEWRTEGTHRLAQLTSRISRRTEAESRLRDPRKIDHPTLAWPGALEAAQQTAITDWIVRDTRPDAAQQLLSEEFVRRHQDLWWHDFLDAPVSAQSLRLLSESQRAYDAGHFAEAERQGAAAEAAFVQLRNPAGRIRARWQRIVSSHRGDQPATCPSLLKGFEAEAQQHSWKWLLAQYWLDEITCRNLLYLGTSLQDRETAFGRIEKMGFEGVSLRALAFLTEPQVASGSPLRIWTRGFSGLTRFWASFVPEYRLHHLAWCLAEAARMAEEPEAAVLLERESVLNLGDNPDHGLRAQVLGFLAVAESRAGLHASSAAHFSEAGLPGSDGDAGLPDKYFYNLENSHAQADIQAGKSQSAAARLAVVMGAHSGRTPPSDMSRAMLANTRGLALLRGGRYTEASAQFGESLAINRRILARPDQQLERESVRLLYEGAYRGATEVQLRSARSPSAALKVWNGFRGWDEPQTSVPPTLTFAALPGGVSAWLSIDGTITQRWLDTATVRDVARSLSGLAKDPEVSAAAIHKAGLRAGKVLLAPFEPQLRARPAIDTLLIDADSMLSHVPWALTEFGNGERLIQRYNIVIAGAHPGLSKAPKGVSAGSRAIVFADPSQSGETEKFPPLVDALAEGQMVARLFHSATLVQGEEATAAAFLRNAPAAQVLHFAGHGINNGGFGGLVMAGGVPFLEARQISGLSLAKLELVVLSACSTGFAEETSTVNADTLVRGFLDAGALRVVASSWDVNSSLTRLLMGRFYAQVMAGQAPASALRSAMLSFASVPATSHPSGWAAFQLYGTP